MRISNKTETGTVNITVTVGFEKYITFYFFPLKSGENGKTGEIRKASRDEEKVWCGKIFIGVGYFKTPAVCWDEIRIHETWLSFIIFTVIHCTSVRLFLFDSV